MPPGVPWVGGTRSGSGGGSEGPLPFFTWGGGGIPGIKMVAGGPHRRSQSVGGGGDRPIRDQGRPGWGLPMCFR